MRPDRQAAGDARCLRRDGTGRPCAAGSRWHGHGLAVQGRCGLAASRCDALFPWDRPSGLQQLDRNHTSVGFEDGAGASGWLGASTARRRSATCVVTLDHDLRTIGANVCRYIQVSVVALGPDRPAGVLRRCTCGSDASPNLCRAFGPVRGLGEREMRNLYLMWS